MGGELTDEKRSTTGLSKNDERRRTAMNGEDKLRSGDGEQGDSIHGRKSFDLSSRPGRELRSIDSLMEIRP